MYELIVIGGGPGGCAAALRAAQGGLSVALFEPRQVGGTCLNRGCVPTKALLHGAGPGCDWPALAAEVERVVSTLRAGQEKQLRAAGVNSSLTGRWSGPHTVEAGGAAYEAAHILVAAGSEPALPPIPGLDTPGVVTSDGLLSDLRPLDRLAIIGGGVIGVELACVWAAAGARVTILEAAPRLLPTLERELGQSLAAQLRQDGVEVFTGAGVTGVAPGCRRLHPREAYRLRPTPFWWPPGGGPPPAASLPGTSCRSWSGGSSGWTDSSAPPSPPFTPSGTPSAGPCWPTRRRRRGALWPTSCWAAPPSAEWPPSPPASTPAQSWPRWDSPPTRPGPGASPVPPASVCWGATPVPSSRGESGALSSWYFTGRAAPCWGLSCAVTATDLISGARLGGHVEADGGANAFRPVRLIPPFAEAISEAVEAAFPLS